MRREQPKKFFTQANILMWTAVVSVLFCIGLIAFAYWAKQDRAARVEVNAEWSRLDREVEQAESSLKNDPDFLAARNKEWLKDRQQKREQVEKRSRERWGKHPRDL